MNSPAVENKEDSRQLEPVIKQVKFYISNQVYKNVVFQALAKDYVPSNEITQNKTNRKLINHISRFKVYYSQKTFGKNKQSIFASLSCGRSSRCSSSGGSCGLLLVLLERAHEGVLVRGCLEATVTKLGAGIDELQLDVLECPSLGVNQERLEKNEVF